MKVTDDYKSVEGKYGYAMISSSVSNQYYFIPLRIGSYNEWNIKCGHIISKDDFVAKSGSCSGKKGDILKKFVLIPETNADDKLLHLAKSDIDFYYYICSSSHSPVHLAYTNFFGVEVE